MSDEHEAGYPQSLFGQETWTLYRVQAGVKLVWLCVVTPEVRAYVYIPDSGRFHLNHGVYVDYIWDQDLTYVPVGVDEARELIEARVGLLPPTMSGARRRRYLTDETLDVEDVLANTEQVHRERDVRSDP